MASLTHLKELILQDNNFSRGLTDLVGDLISLEKLNLADCRLTELPSRYSIYNTVNDCKLI